MILPPLDVDVEGLTMEERLYVKDELYQEAVLDWEL